jgi:hypothetical protein
VFGEAFAQAKRFHSISTSHPNARKVPMPIAFHTTHPKVRVAIKLDSLISDGRRVNAGSSSGQVYR